MNVPFTAPDTGVTYDAIIVGSGAGGSMAAYTLVQRGLRVLLVEKGNVLPKDSTTLDVDRVVREGAFKSREPWVDRHGSTLVPEEYFNLGGKTKWYGAALARFAAHEFAADAARGYLAFPFAYTELEPFYARAEQLLGVRRVPTEPDLAKMLGRLARRSPEWTVTALPLGLSTDIERHRLEATHFDGFASPRGLKADGETSLLMRVAGTDKLHVSTGRSVESLERDALRPERVVGVRLADGTAYRAPHVILAAGALHSPRLVQRYLQSHGLTHLPLVENVGRRLKLHLLTAVLALSATPKHDLLRKTALLVNERLPQSSAQPLGFDGELLANLIPSYVPRRLAKAIGNRAYGFFLQTEDGSHADNRVIAPGTDGNTGGAVPKLDYDAALRTPLSEQEHRQFVSSFRRSLFNAGYVNFSQRIALAGTAHACGTMVAGTDAATSAVDPDGRVRGLDGLLVVDGSVLPRISRVNPALTIYAWSLRVAEKLVQRIEQSRSRHTPAQPTTETVT